MYHKNGRKGRATPGPHDTVEIACDKVDARDTHTCIYNRIPTNNMHRCRTTGTVKALTPFISITVAGGKTVLLIVC